jgi:hypothetical protein
LAHIGMRPDFDDPSIAILDARASPTFCTSTSVNAFAMMLAQCCERMRGANEPCQNWRGPGGFAAEPPYNYQPTCKPGSVWPAARTADVTAIPLVRRLPGASSNLPK